MYQKRGALAELSFNEVSTGLKNLSGHIVHPQPFNIFRCSHGTLNGYASEFSNGEGDVIRDDTPQHSVAMLEQRCNHSKQYRNNVATPCCGLREKLWLRIRLNVRIFSRSKIRPVAFLTFSLQLSPSRHRKLPLEGQV